jgi:DNA helicase-2/ATP-dependent DNA helicase PcrA
MTKLNLEQQRAVDTTEGPVLIIAGAGSGKTRVITHRILNLIKNGVDPRSILAITFTNKAAKEMRDRVSALLSEDNMLNKPVSFNEKPFISTFHALGVFIIKENAGLLGLTRHFTIYDRSDSKRAVKDAMEQCSINPKEFDPGVFLNKISRAKGENMNRIEYADKAKDHFEDMVAQVWEKYDAIIAKDKAVDFDDLLLKTARLLRENKNVREKYQSIWKYIHIDEYQDTNKVQYEIASLLTGENKNICVVGDVDQNIYSWRGATIENIMNFEKDYPNATTITLEMNYRSTKTILEAANAVIEKNTIRRKKTLRTDSDYGEKISMLVSYTEADEARNVADLAKDIIQKGTIAKDIAVLYRANFQSRIIEEAFIKKNIEYQLVGTRFFDRKEIKDVLSYIRASLNRDSSADIARIINIPARGIGKATLAKILAGQQDILPPAMKVKLSSFWKLLADIKIEVTTKKPSESVKFVIQESGIENMLRQGDGEDEERLLNVQELVSVAKQYDEMDPEAGMEAFLSNSALASDQDDLEKPKDGVKLMTVHAAKGLEFDYVFIVGLEENLFPFKHADDSEMSQSEEEEERRLFYVAITRARKKLYLSYAMLRTIFGNQKVNNPSEFLNDIDQKLIENSEPAKPSGAKAIFIDF